MTDELKQWEYDRGYAKGQADVLEKVRAEIKTNTEKWWYGVNDDCFMKLSDVLEIIDKYREVSENGEVT